MTVGLASGLSPAGLETLNVCRVEAGLPAWGAELGPAIVPLEARLEKDAISFSKGCYTGQEIIARVTSRSQVNNLLAGFLFEAGAEPPDAGTVIEVDGAGRGRITSSILSPRHGRPLALGYLRREYQAPGTHVTAGGVPGEVVSMAHRFLPHVDE
jgi:folate-binding protein YgfZ